VIAFSGKAVAKPFHYKILPFCDIQYYIRHQLFQKSNLQLPNMQLKNDTLARATASPH
jgi:hypothetical protein